MNDFNHHESNGFNRYYNDSYNEPTGGQEEFGAGDQIMERPFYERIWFIVIMLICFWPAGLLLAIWRFIRDKEIAAYDPNQTPPPFGRGAGIGTGMQAMRARRTKVASKRSCKGWKIAGWILLIMGLLDLTTITTYTGMGDLISTAVTGVGLTIAGVILIVRAKRTVAKWDRYESFINKKGNTSIPWLAVKMGLPENTVRVDVQAMINKGFFDRPKYGISAYINGEYDLVVMTKYDEVMEPLRKAKPVQEEKAPPANSYLAKLRQEMNRTEDQDLLETLRDIEESISKIEAKIADEPSLKDMTNIRQLKETYLPQTLELIRKFNDGEGSEQTRWEIRAMLGTCAKAFDNIEAKVYERDDIDTKVDMEVLRKTFEREGLLGSDFNIES